MPKISLRKIDTRAPKGVDKNKTKDLLPKIVEQLDELQNKMFAEQKHSLLVILQGMDASGKDGLTKAVFGELNPLGIKVSSFKVPTAKELSHDFLWRIHQEVPAKGEIKIFNRSHYEDILVTRVHQLIDERTAIKRMKAINDFEDLLVKHNNTAILKIYLHISPEEQQERLKERMTDPRKMWKYNAKDFEEAKKWNQYMKVYEDAFNECNKIPWHIIPADQNWYRNHLVASLVLKTMNQMNMKYPTIEK